MASVRDTYLCLEAPTGGVRVGKGLMSASGLRSRPLNRLAGPPKRVTYPLRTHGERPNGGLLPCAPWSRSMPGRRWAAVAGAEGTAARPFAGWFGLLAIQDRLLQPLAPPEAAGRAIAELRP
jgi:hypothetical protein